MGARVYIPALGRFLQVDPVEGGTDNSYASANDPVNQFDLDGQAIPLLFLAGVALRAAAPHIARAAVKYVAKPAGNFVVKKAVPFLQKKAVAAAGKIKQAVKTGATKAVQWIAKNDPLFGYKKGILNRGPHRIGYAKDKSNIVFRMGKPGSHNHRFSIKLPVKWRGYR